MKRNIYLNTLPIDKALSIYADALDRSLRLRVSTVETVKALGRITSEAVYASLNSPLYDSAAMDGIAVDSALTAGASEVSPVFLKKEDYLSVDTGDPVRPPYDAVVMAEDIIGVEGETVEIRSAAAPWQHVRPIGEDITRGEMIIPGGRKLGPFDIGVLLSGGVTELPVYEKPVVAIVPTGTEIVEAGTSPEEGEIIESNSRMLEGLVIEDGGLPHRIGIVPDDYEKLKESFSRAIDEHDMLIAIAGSSAGTEDFTAKILAELGEVIVHGVAMKPGKPVILAICRGKPVVGIPGYPVSAYIAYSVFARMALCRLNACLPAAPITADAVIARRLVSSLKHREYVRVRLGKVDGRLVATPLARGAGAAMSLVRADGFAIIDQNSEGFEQGETTAIELLRNPAGIDATIVCTGSHDILVDLIDDLLSKGRTGMSVSATHVGSLGGLMAIKNREAHIAPVHLLDTKSGEYNISAIRELFPGGGIALIKGVGRVQGIMLRPGNPHGIKGIADLPSLSGQPLRYVNRQRGAGTRLLFDYLLEREGIEPLSIDGYSHEVATHMAVAAAVMDGSADAGMGVYSAAFAMGLDFLKIADEEYDFAVPEGFLTMPIIEEFIRVLKSDELKDELSRIGGYTCERAGDIIII